MVRFSALLILVVAVIFATQSCNKSKNEDCPFLAPQVVYVGFTEEESDTLVIRRFEKNTNFSKLIDTMRITRAHINRIQVGKDSQRLDPNNYPQLNTLFYLHDWQIYLPGAQQTMEITNATPRFTQEKEPSAQCQSYVSSVVADGYSYSFNSWFDTQYRIFAVKQ